MWRPVAVTAAPATEPIPTADAKAHLRVDHSDDDTLIATYVASARSHVEGLTGTRMVTQTVSLKTDDWADLAHLPVAPIQSISSISYVDSEGEVQTLSTNAYETRLELLEPAVVLKWNQTWPTRRAGTLITVTAIAGYGAVGAQPPAVLHALRLVTADFYAQRETLTDGGAVSAPIAATVDALLCNHRIHLI
jgi:uncharacterized phiE125 gp8 family phage protein